jgi:hypothetical protein
MDSEQSRRFAGVLELMTAIGSPQTAIASSPRAAPQPLREGAHSVLFMQPRSGSRAWIPFVRGLFAAIAICALAFGAVIAGRQILTDDSYADEYDPLAATAAGGSKAAPPPLPGLNRTDSLTAPLSATAGIESGATATDSAPVAKSKAATNSAAAAPTKSLGTAAARSRDNAATKAAAKNITAPTVPALVLPGSLSVSSRPWAHLYIDGTRIGNTPIRGISLPAGYHSVRLEREGFRSFETRINIGAGSSLRLSDIILERDGS